MERKKRVTWMLTWLNVSAAALNVTFQLLVIYRYRSLVATIAIGASSTSLGRRIGPTI